MRKDFNPQDAADDRATMARLRALMPKVVSSRQRRMLREAMSHIGGRIGKGR